MLSSIGNTGGQEYGSVGNDGSQGRSIAVKEFLVDESSPDRCSDFEGVSPFFKFANQKKDYDKEMRKLSKSKNR